MGYMASLEVSLGDLEEDLATLFGEDDTATEPSIGLSTMVRELTSMVTEEKQALGKLMVSISQHTATDSHYLDLHIQHHIRFVYRELLDHINHVEMAMLEVLGLIIG